MCKNICTIHSICVKSRHTICLDVTTLLQDGASLFCIFSDGVKHYHYYC